MSISGPVRHAAPTHRAARFVFPDLRARLRLECKDRRGGGEIHLAVDDQWGDLKIQAAGIEDPGLLQCGDVLRGDLRQGRKTLRA